MDNNGKTSSDIEATRPVLRCRALADSGEGFGKWCIFFSQ